MKICPNCGHENNENSKFCEECGTKLVAVPKFCPECGAKLDKPVKFCPNCGFNFLQKEKMQESNNKTEKTEHEKDDVNIKSDIKNFFKIFSNSSLINDSNDDYEDYEVSDENAKEKFMRTKPHMNIGLIGHSAQGKTTLSAAITQYCARKYGDHALRYDEIDNSPEEKAHGYTINTHHLEYQSDKRHYNHIDCPGNADYIKKVITGISQMDGAVLVVSAADGVMSQTYEHLLLARQLGVQKIIVFLNKVDLIDSDQDLLNLVEEQIKSTIQQYGFSPDTPIIRGSALKVIDEPENSANKCIEELLSTMDTWFDEPTRSVTSPFLMPIEDVSETERGTVVTGRIEHGSVEINSPVEIVGIRPAQQATVTGVEMFNKTLDLGISGDYVSIFLSGIEKDDIEQGQFLAEPNTINTYRKFKAQLYVLDVCEGGVENPFSSGRPQFYFPTTDITDIIDAVEFDGGIQMIKSGNNVDITVELSKPVVFKELEKIIIREGGRIIAYGYVTEVIE